MPLRRCPEQDVVDHGLVLERDDLDLLGHGEHHVEVGHVEQFRLSIAIMARRRAVDNDASC
jgi:hypothetical protein